MLPGGGVPLARASLILAKLKADNDDQRFGIEIVRKAVQTPLVEWQIAENAGEDGAVIAGKTLDKDENTTTASMRRAASSRTLREGRHHRPDQGRAHGTAGRRLGRRPAGDHRGDGGREAGEEGSTDVPGRRPQHGRYGLLTSSSKPGDRQLQELPERVSLALQYYARGQSMRRGG